MSDYPVMWFHCSGLIRDGALRNPCEAKAVVFYIRPDSVKVGYCGEHGAEVKTEAPLKRWERAA